MEGKETTKTVDENLLKAKEVIFKFLKKFDFSNIKNKNFFEFWDDYDGNEIESISFRLEPYEVQLAFIEILKEKIKKTECYLESEEDGFGLSCFINKKDN